MKLVLIAIAAFVGSPSLAADQFDLICEGTVQGRINGPQEPIQQRFSFDLSTNRYCKTTMFRGEQFNGLCQDVLHIDEVTPDRIDFINDQPGTYYYIERQSGALRQFMRSPYHNERGQCDLAEYRPLPSAKF